jgi:hypothetical protein
MPLLLRMGVATSVRGGQEGSGGDACWCERVCGAGQVRVMLLQCCQPALHIDTRSMARGVL